MDRTDNIEDSVLVKLSVSQPDDIDHAERRLRLFQSRPHMLIGRSSTRAQVDLQPAVANGWFNSPVMSRNQAEITADIPNKAVFIRDLDSMHGTYLNKVRVSGEPTPLHPEDEVIFGLPVYRHDTNFEPVHVRVDGIEFQEAPRQTTTPTRVFTVPDDCSTDDNEPFDDEPLPSSSKGPAVVVLEEIRYTPRSPRASIPQLDGVIDLVSEASDDESLISHNDNDRKIDDRKVEGHRMDFYRRFHVDLGEDDYESVRLTDHAPSSTPGSVIGSDMSDASSLAGHLVNSPSPSWDSLSSAADDSHMDEDEDDLSGHGSEQDDVFIMSDSESGDEDSIRDNQAFQDNDNDSVSSENEQATPVRGIFVPQPPVSQPPAQDSQASSRWLPPINTIISSGRLGFNTTSLDSDRLRLPSPSDALLPHSNRRQETGSMEQQSTNDSESAVPQAKNTDALAATETLGQKSGKPEFFEAREHNKMTIARLTEHYPRPAFPEPIISAPGTSCTQAYSVPVVPSVWSHIPHNSWQPYGPDHVAYGTETEAAAFRHSIPELSRLFSPEIHISNQSTSPLMYDRASRPVTTSNSFEISRLAGPLGSPAAYAASALELQQEKWWIPDNEVHDDSRAQKPRERKQHPELARDAQSFGPPRSSSGDGEVRKQMAEGPDKDSSATEMQKQDKGKRKAEMISEVTEADMAWAATDFSRSLGESQANDRDIRLSGAASPLISPPSPSVRVQSNFPSPPTTPEATANSEARPSKRMKKIAERVGYAALGGATVGAMVLTSLIYSAPTFV